MAQLTRETHSLRRETHELGGLLEQSRSECNDLKNKLDEVQLHAATSAPVGLLSLEESLRDARSPVNATNEEDSDIASDNSSLTSSAPPTPSSTTNTDATISTPSSIAPTGPRTPLMLPLGENEKQVDSFSIEEYFFLSATAVKIDLAVKHAEHSDLVFRMDAHALYKEVLKQQIPFHEWWVLF